MSPPAAPSGPIPGAPHFTWAEMLASDTASRYKLDNTPPPEARERIIHLAGSFLEPLRLRFGPIRVLSGYRSPELNWFVSLSRHSRHCRGEAADLRFLASEYDLAAILSYIHNVMPFHELDLHPGPRPWLHLACRTDGPPQAKLLLSQPGRKSRRAGLDELLAAL